MYTHRYIIAVENSIVQHLSIFDNFIGFKVRKLFLLDLDLSTQNFIRLNVIQIAGFCAHCYHTERV